jgi:high-affinity iron transporter
MAAFLVMLREGVEAALIVAILLAYLDRTDRRHAFTQVWWGTGAAVLLSSIAGVVIWNTVGSLEGRAEELVEGIVALVAAGLLTWMIFWMGSQARSLRSQLETQANEALTSGAVALAAVPFVAVAREGFESVLFLLSTTVGAKSGQGQLIGGLLGVLAALAIGYLVYRGSHLIDLRKFFRVTGFLIVLFAAGLVAKGVHELQEVGIIPVFVEHLWELGFLDPDTSTFAAFLKTMFGWDPDPSLLQVLAYFGYLIPISARYHGMTSAPRPDRQEVPVRSESPV